MAGLDPPLPPVRASEQVAAIGYLRWRLFVNGFRRKGGKGELVARILVYPVALFFVLVIITVAGGAAYLSAHSSHLSTLDLIFTVITVLQVLVSVNIAPPGMSFDPESLIRYPLRFRTYLLLRLMLGLFSASTIFGTAALLAAALGVTIAQPRLGLAVFAAALALALTNIIFIRMIFIWIDRWLSTRRAREILTGFFLVVTLGYQYVNATFMNIGHHSSAAVQRAKVAAALRFYTTFHGWLTCLPSGRGAATVLQLRDGNTIGSLLNLALVLLYAAGFLAIFAWRIRREYHGEDLSQASASPQPVALPAQAVGLTHSPAPALTGARGASSASLLAGDLAACLGKEWIYLRRNLSQLYGLVAPLAMVLIFAGRLGPLSRTGYAFPAAVAYALLSTAALAYNSFGLDGSGVQFYFLAPVRMRSVLLAKNLFAFGINAVQVLLVYLFFAWTATAPPIFIVLSTLLWAILIATLNATIGNRRSLTTPTRMDPTKLNRRQASGLSALMALVLVLGVAALGGGLLAWGAWSGKPWLPIPVLAVLAAITSVVYLRALNGLDTVAGRYREALISALAKT